MKKKLQILALIIGIASLAIVGFVDWRISLGFMLFGWAMNLENEARQLKD